MIIIDNEIIKGLSKDIKEFFKHLKLSKKDYYTMDDFYKWHREYKDRNE